MPPTTCTDTGDLFISVFISRVTSRWQIGGVWSGIANIAVVPAPNRVPDRCHTFTRWIGGLIAGDGRLWTAGV
jgi:hypothetical protein